MMKNSDLTVLDIWQQRDINLYTLKQAFYARIQYNQDWKEW